MPAGEVFTASKLVKRPRARKEIELRSLVAKYSDGTTPINDADHTRLRQLAMTNGGLLKTEYRKVAWLVLTRTSERDLANNVKPPQEKLRAHKDYTQVAMDVRRALSRFPPGLTDAQRLAMTDSLIDAIMRILFKNKELNYYQGFHDVVVTFLIVLGEDWTVAVLEKLCKTHFRDFMRPSIEQTQRFLQLVYVILGEANVDLYDHLVNASVGTMFCLPWLLTWFGHVLHSLDDILRIFDLFVSATPLVPLYLAAAIVLFYQPRIMVCPAELADMHHLLTNLTGSVDDMHEAPVAVRHLGVDTQSQSDGHSTVASNEKPRGSPTAKRAARRDPANQKSKSSAGHSPTITSKTGPPSLPVEEWVQIALDLYVEYPPENLFVTADEDLFVERYIKLERDCAVMSFEAVPLRRDPLLGAGTRSDSDGRSSTMRSRMLPLDSTSRSVPLRAVRLRRLRLRLSNAFFALRASLGITGSESNLSRFAIGLLIISLLVAFIAITVAYLNK